MERPWNRTTKPTRYTRAASDSRYHSTRWTKLSSLLRKTPEFALCADCKKRGIYTPAQVVDHIKPAFLCNDEEFFDIRNLQPLCQRCNHAKGQRDKRLKK